MFVEQPLALSGSANNMQFVFNFGQCKIFSMIALVSVFQKFNK